MTWGDLAKKAPGAHKLAIDVMGPTKLSPETIARFRQIAVEVAVEEEAARFVQEARVEEYRAQGLEPPEVPKRKNRRHNLKTGMIFGLLVLRRKAAPRKGVKPTLREQWHVECMGKGCGRKIIVPKYYLTRPNNPKTHCGCQFQTLKSTHGREYRIYHMMHQRCMNPNHTSYKHYKERGITIYEPWQKHNPDGFEKWLEEIGPCPTPNHSLDRIRNNKGYEPGNIKWSTASEQRLNQGELIGGKTLEEIAELNMTEDEWVEHVKKHGY